ncbi:hypothetical protein [Paraburkholderia sp. CNPSo 3281]|uniref:hypothetical protein n=1 Tax=Paraburkholderia sp. CNPSo 3281 TaxID=2940933 RepID=UPI0020B79506|nr:hypothetical protein [Paraburkholderia sp. CNPSo 3281]MCP3715461.1 hypothetical protein [Paraburkholderia sp. CNPSo 3281]
MKFDFSVTRSLHLYGLSFPFDVILECSRGHHNVEGVEPAPSLRQRCVQIPVSRRFDYHLQPDVSGAAAAVAHILCEHNSGSAMTAEDWSDLAQASSNKTASISLSLARKMFLYPRDRWALTTIAEHTHTTVRALQARIFRENAAFSEILARQRRLRALLDMLEMGVHVGDASLTISHTRVEASLKRCLKRSFLIL